MMHTVTIRRYGVEFQEAVIKQVLDRTRSINKVGESIEMPAKKFPTSTHRTKLIKEGIAMKGYRSFLLDGLGAFVLASALLMLAGTHGLAAPKKVDVNTASEKEFAQTLGIDAELAKLIGQYREKEAPIESWDEFLPPH